MSAAALLNSSLAHTCTITPFQGGTADSYGQPAFGLGTPVTGIRCRYFLPDAPPPVRSGSVTQVSLYDAALLVPAATVAEPGDQVSAILLGAATIAAGPFVIETVEDRFGAGGVRQFRRLNLRRIA